MVWLAILAGVAVRLGLWWQDRAFWRDEAGLVQSLDAYSTTHLLGPLADAQSAPQGWLLAERLVTSVLGDGERAYRLIPLLAGCGSLVVLGYLANAFVRRGWTAAIPVLLAGTASQPVFYAAQAKQYTTDILLVTALMLAGVRLVRDARAGTVDRRLLIGWYAGIALGAWFSNGLMLAAPLAALWVAYVQWRAGVRPLRRLALGIAAPAASVLGAALWTHHLTSLVGDFEAYWRPFLGPRGTDGFRAWTALIVEDFALRGIGLTAVWALGLIGLGLAAAFARRWSRSSAVLLLVPVVSTYVAALAGAYPFGRRLVLFCVPGLLVGLAVLVDVAAALVVRLIRAKLPRSSPIRHRAWLTGTSVALLATAGLGTVAWTTPAQLDHDLTYQYGVDDYRAALRFVAAHWTKGDAIVMGNGDRAAYRVYGPRLGLPADRAFRAMPRANDSGLHTDCALPAVLRETGRIWLVTGDQAIVYPGQTSRYALVAPMLDRYRIVWTDDKGLVTTQLAMAGPSPQQPARATRCLTYALMGPAGAPKFPATLPAP